MSKKAQLPAIRITEQPILLTKSKIKRAVITFLSIFAENGQSKLVFVLVLVVESKGPLRNQDGYVDEKDKFELL